MNTQLDKLYEIYNISEKNRYEINQIFWLLPPEKKQKLLRNFVNLSYRLEQIHKEIDLERRILVWDLFEDIKVFYNKYWKQVWTL